MEANLTSEKYSSSYVSNKIAKEDHNCNKPGRTLEQGTPMQQGAPKQPGTPMQQGASKQPGAPKQPGTPMQQGTPMQPGAPKHPGTPMQPGAPKHTGTPIQPGTPKHTGTPMQPGTPMHTGTPMQPGAPKHTGTPIQPGTPKHTATPMQPGTPMHTGTPMQPGAPMQQRMSLQKGMPMTQRPPMQQGETVQQRVPMQQGVLKNQYDVAIHQPGVITTQPKAGPTQELSAPREWSSGICGCFEDCESCALVSLFCPCYTCCCLSPDMGEHCCTPILVPDTVVALRMKMRTKYNIKGSLIGDCCCFFWCPLCTVCQLAREVKYIEELINGVAFRKFRNLRTDL